MVNGTHAPPNIGDSVASPTIRRAVVGVSCAFGTCLSKNCFVIMLPFAPVSTIACVCTFGVPKHV